MSANDDKYLMKRSEFIRKMGLTTGSFLLSPIIDKLIGEAWGATSTKKRFIIYMNGSSMLPSLTQTSGSGSSFVLPASLKPLEPFKNDLNVLRNVYCSVYPNLHGNMYGTLSGVPCVGISANDNEAYLKARPGGATIDTILSKELGGGTRFQEMVLGYCRPGQTSLANGYDSIKTPVMNVNEAFQKYFLGNAPVLEASLQKKKNILDFVAGDISRANRGLAGSEKGKFDEYVAAVSDLGKRITATNTPSDACSTYSFPSVGTAPDGKTYPTNPNYTNLAGMEWLYNPGFVGNSYIQADMIGLALGCGITRHATFVSQLGEMHQNYKDIFGVSLDVHGDINHGVMNGVAGAIDQASTVMKFHASVVAKMYAKLKATPEGSGTAADNTVILWLSDCGGSHHFGHYDGTVFLLGNAGGALRTNQSITFADRQYSLSQLLFTISKALGSTITQVGDGSNPGSTTIPGLLV